ncbi:HAD-IA family hydrolase [bacterium]|nr:HAD-IA family hydrolase [bacterium]
MTMLEGAMLWDLDGTIADTADLHFRAWRETLADERIAYTRTDFERDFGRSNPELLAELLPDRSTAQHRSIAAHKEDVFRHLMHEAVTLLPGVTAWMDELRTAGVTQVVCSSGPMANIASTVARLEIADYFLSLVSGVHVPRGKPAPDLFLRGAAVAGKDPATCLVVEDSRHGVEAAAAAGMRCVVVGALAQQQSALFHLFAHPHHLIAVEDLSTRGCAEVLAQMSEAHLNKELT